ncbi:MAG: DNA-binding response regulator [Planctomycetota bacterium]|nr:MAG: DNA-binding response regulator [Planctomycetota bacterium]
MSDQAVVYVVDDDAQARKAVATLVEAMGLPVQSYGSAEDFLAAYDGRRPACLVTDVRMMGMSGLELQEELIRQGKPMSVIVMTGFANTPGTVRAMKNGALTLLEKPCRDDELWEAIRNGLAADREALAEGQTVDELRRRYATLTAKEREVLKHISAGDANKIVARRMGVSLRTVELHRQSVFQKMGADSLAELVRMVVALEGENKSAPA